MRKNISNIFLYTKEFFCWAVIGVIATLVHYGVYIFMNKFIPIEISYTIGYVCSFFLNFILNTRYTFKTKASIKKGIGFGLSHLVNYLLQILLLKLFLYFGVSETLAPLPVYIIVVPINFLLVRFVFKTNKI